MEILKDGKIIFCFYARSIGINPLIIGKEKKQFERSEYDDEFRFSCQSEEPYEKGNKVWFQCTDKLENIKFDILYEPSIKIYQQGWPHSIHELYWERQLKTCGPIIEEKTDNEKWNKWHKKHIMKINPENT